VLPGWLREAVVYEIFVDRFANGNHWIDPPNAAAWGSAPGAAGFMGGDLAGIASRLEYLAGMGVNVLYLTPIFLASSNHRYNTYDYFTIDPRIGTLDEFRHLVANVHRRGMRILLDGVFNHCGRGFFPFFDVMENGEASAWAGWFRVDGYPVEAYGRHRFDGWLGAAEVPEIDLSNPGARDYMLRVAEYWTAQGIDGWRLDAVPHVRHRPFWAELRDVVRRVNPDAYLLAEIWEDPFPWLNAGFDGATNYAFREAVVQFLFARTLTASAFAACLERATSSDPCVAAGMCNLLGSHDTPRLWTLAGGDERLVRMALTLLFAFPGIPSVYYGDETGLEGGNEPDNRRAMEWDERRWNTNLRPFIHQLSARRRSVRALREGRWETDRVDDRRGLCVFRRRAGDDECLVIVDLEARSARLEGGRTCVAEDVCRVQSGL
jgi:glycosidase